MYLYIIDLFCAEYCATHCTYLIFLFVLNKKKVMRKKKERDIKTKIKLLTSTSINLEPTVRQLDPAMVK